jgi:hypothetical protein
VQVAGSGEMLELVPDSSATPIATAFAGKSVLVEGTFPEAAKSKSPGFIRYRSIEEEKSK